MVTFSAPTFTGLDVGLAGSPLNPASAQSVVLVEPGAALQQAIEFGFPGFSGAFRHTIGSAPLNITWRLTIRAESLVVLAAIDQSIRDAMNAGEGDLIDADGRTYPRTALAEHRPGTRDIIRDAARFGWVRRADVLTFRVLAPL